MEIEALKMIKQLFVAWQGLEIKIVTDKDEYAKGEEIKVDIIVTNTNDY